MKFTIAVAVAWLGAVQTCAALNLPRIPWEGGPDYWKQFSKADAAGWDDPSFFPIAMFFEQFSSDAEVKWDKSLGGNTYLGGLNNTTDFRHIVNNNMFYIGGRANSSFDLASNNWVGYTACDECEQHSQSAVDDFKAQVAAYPDDGRFVHANYTQQIIGAFGTPGIWEQWVNALEVLSIDMYWYTLPTSSFTYAGGFLVPVANPRTASAYGTCVKGMRIRDASDGDLIPVWMYIEGVYGGPGGSSGIPNITPNQLKAAVMNSIINEARGIIYFIPSMGGSCMGLSWRNTQYNSSYCAATQTMAAKEVNAQVHQLAPIINTQSYDYSFGTGLNTMLKEYNGYCYIFAMVDNATANNPGNRTLTMPPDLSAAATAEVLYESRNVSISGGQLTDDFSPEYTYHIYKIASPSTAVTSGPAVKRPPVSLTFSPTASGWALRVPAALGPVAVYSADGCRAMAPVRPVNGQVELGRNLNNGVYFVESKDQGYIGSVVVIK